MCFVVGFDGVVQQIEEYLFEQYVVGIQWWWIVGYCFFYCYLLVFGFLCVEVDGFVCYLVEVECLQVLLVFVQEGVQVFDYFCCVVGVFVDLCQFFGYLFGGFGLVVEDGQVLLVGVGVVYYCCQWLVDFVGDV